MKKQCNFCGRTEKEVRLLITGVNGCICEDCAVQAYQVAAANEACAEAQGNQGTS